MSMINSLRSLVKNASKFYNRAFQPSLAVQNFGRFPVYASNYGDREDSHINFMAKPKKKSPKIQDPQDDPELFLPVEQSPKQEAPSATPAKEKAAGKKPLPKDLATETPPTEKPTKSKKKETPEAQETPKTAKNDVSQAQETQESQEVHETPKGEEVHETHDANGTPKPQENEAHGPTTVAVPFMITRMMKYELADLGYTQEDINRMTPAKAHEILQSRKKKKSSE